MENLRNQSEVDQKGATIPETGEIRKFAWHVGDLLVKNTNDERFLAFETREGLTDFLTAILLIEAHKKFDTA